MLTSIFAPGSGWQQTTEPTEAEPRPLTCPAGSIQVTGMASAPDAEALAPPSLQAWARSRGGQSKWQGGLGAQGEGLGAGVGPVGMAMCGEGLPTQGPFARSPERTSRDRTGAGDGRAPW